MNLHVSSSSSFFDYQNDPNAFIFIKPELNHRHYLALQPTTKTQNTRCLNLNTGTFLEGTFKLHGNLLAYYYDPSEISPRRVLDLQYARIKAYEANMSSSRYALRLTKYNTSFELYFNNENILDYWVECLMSVGVFPSVEAIYTPLVFFKENFLSSTYIAQNKKTSEFFVLKRFSKDKFHQPHYKTLLLNQITMMRSFNHPNIVGLHQVFETYTTIYFVKPYNSNETLGAFLRRSDPNVELQTPRIINSILQALSYLASEGIILQNLNINSVILTKEGNVKIIDFLYLTRSNMADLAQQKALCPGYIAPEVLKYDKRIPETTFNEVSNVFSVGCILFEMLFGFPLFNNNNPVNILRLNKSFNYSTVSDIIKEEIQNPQSSINKRGLELLLMLLEPDFNKRISAREAQNHSYFQIEEQHQYQINIPLEKVRSLGYSSKKSDSEQYSPSISCSQASSNNRSPTSAGTKVYPGSVSSNMLSIPTSFLMTRRRNYTDFDKHSQSALLKESEEKVFHRKSVSFVDQLYGRDESQSPQDLREDTGELSEADAELESCNIEAFLDSHRIQISLKNPGKFY